VGALVTIRKDCTMATIASVSVKYGRKFPIRRDDWVNLEALVTLTVSAEEADLTDPAHARRRSLPDRPRCRPHPRSCAAAPGPRSRSRR
jgi:hypothetical protein